jgi:hypothetical protein
MALICLKSGGSGRRAATRRIRAAGVGPSATRTARRTTSRLWRSQSPSTTWQVAYSPPPPRVPTSSGVYCPRQCLIRCCPFHREQLLWVGWGYVYTLPAERVSGIYAPANGAKNATFFGVFLMFVPSLSWQNDRFCTDIAPKRVAFFAGEFSSPVFTMPNGATAINSGLYLNAAASWHGKVVTGGCDEGCTACASTHTPHRRFFC